MNELKLIYFSPTGTTHKVVMETARSIDLKSVSFDLTIKKDLKPVAKFAPNDFALFAIPEYEDALLELKTEVEKRGFKVIGAAAFPAEHSIVNSIGARRPNKADLKEASEYGISLNRIIKKEDSFASFDLKVPGNTPYRKYGKNVLFPKADVSLCTECSACAKICPAGAISLDNPKKTDHDKCIGCMKCVRFCKQKARYVSAFKLNMAAKKLTKVCQSDKKAEIFL